MDLYLSYLDLFILQVALNYTKKMFIFKGFLIVGTTTGRREGLRNKRPLVDSRHRWLPREQPVALQAQL